MPSPTGTSQITAAVPAAVVHAAAMPCVLGDDTESPSRQLDVPGSAGIERNSASLSFDSVSAELGSEFTELDSAITELEEVERLTRKVEATRVSALARLNRVVHLAFEAAGGIGQFEDSLEYRAARADAATALRLSEQTIERHLRQAKVLATQYPDTLCALDTGAISYRHATIILDAGEIIGAVGQEDSAEISAKRAAFESQVLQHAIVTTPNRLQPIAKRIAEQFALEDLDTRFEQERRRRAVWVAERENGMADLVAYLPAHEAYGIYSRLTQIAQRIEAAEKQEARAAGQEQKAQEDHTADVADVTVTGADTDAADAADVDANINTGNLGESQPALPFTHRFRGEIRADLLADLLLNGTGESASGGSTHSRPGTGISGISGVVQVICQQQHLQATSTELGLGLGLELGLEADESLETCRQLPFPELEGYGPIPVGMARSIAGGTQAFTRVTLHPATADVMRVDRYRPSVEMRRFLTARDQHCRFPGCRVPAHRCDADHTVDAALGGPTSTDNLGMLCRGHHTLKHHTKWKAKQHPDGVYEWTSPTGRTHLDAPVSRVRFSSSYGTANLPAQNHEPTLTSRPSQTSGPS